MAVSFKRQMAREGAFKRRVAVAVMVDRAMSAPGVPRWGEGRGKARKEAKAQAKARYSSGKGS